MPFSSELPTVLWTYSTTFRTITVVLDIEKAPYKWKIKKKTGLWVICKEIMRWLKQSLRYLHAEQTCDRKR